MADVRQLTVSLLLDSNNFEKNIRLINQQIREAESEFKLAGAGIENFEKTLGGMGEKAKMLRTQLDGQAKSVQQFEARLRQANNRMQESVIQHSRMSEQYREAKADLQLYQREIEETERVLAGAKLAGDNLIVEGLEEKLANQRREYQEMQAAVDKLGSQIDAVERSWNKQNATISSTTIGLNNARAEVERLRKELALSENEWYKHGVAMETWGEQAKTAAANVERVGNTLTRTVTTPIMGLGAATLKASIDYESAFAGVRKTVDATGEDAEAFFEGLSDSVIEMSKRLATGAGEIAGVMEIAGQLGIANEELEGFTETIIRLGMSTNMAGEQAASQMARFANITGMQQDQFEAMGSTLVYLGNTMATTESEIMTMAMRIAAAGSQVGLSDQHILGFAAALSSLGIEAEAGGSAFSKALKKMEVAVATGNEQLSDFAKVAGLTEKEFAALWESNPAGAFEAFIGGLSKMDEAGMSAIATLDDIGITELRLTDTLLRSTNATELIRQALEGANTAWAENEALQKESNTRLQTTESRLKNIKNSLVAVGIEFADTMVTEFEWIIGQLQGAVEWLDSLDDATKRNITTWAAYAAAAGPAISLIGKIGGTLGSTVGALGKFAQAWGKIQTTFKTTHSLIGALTAGLGPGGALMLGLGAAAAAVAGIIALYNKLEESKPDFSIDTSEIDKYRIDVESLRTTINVDTSVNVKGDVLSLKDKFVQILNDGVPETQEVRDSMQADVDAAVAEAYKVIDESFAAKKAELDTLFESGIIDKTTYDNSLETLKGQAETMEADLTAKSTAVTTYLTTLCDQNRATTEEEIAQLNALLEALGLTAEEVMKANDAQMQVYKWSYDKTRLGIGSEEDAKRAAEYIEILADQKLREIDAQEQALKELYASGNEGLDEEEQIRKAEEETEALKRLQEQRNQVYGQRTAEYGGLTSSLLQQAGFTEEDLKKAEEAIRLMQEYDLNFKEGVDWKTQYGALIAGVFSEDDLLGAADTVKEFYKKLDESGLLDGNTTINAVLATLVGDGSLTEEAVANTSSTANTVIELATQAETAAESVTAAATSISSSAETAAQEAESALNETTGSDMGMDTMRGMKNGIEAGQGSVVQAMRQAARAAVNAAKKELGIHSPSRVMQMEVGVQATRGAALGMIEEARKQAKVIRNAYRQLTDEAQAGAMAGTDNRRTYNSESSVSVTGNTFVIRDQLDVQSLAIEIASLTRGYQRGKGMKMA